MNGYCTTLEEWIYPDQELSKLPTSLSLHSCKNGREGISLILETDKSELNILIKVPKGITYEIFEMIDVRVEYNEVETEEQSGMFVITEKEYEKPSYCTRKAPFRVYEALQPAKTC